MKISIVLVAIGAVVSCSSFLPSSKRAPAVVAASPPCHCPTADSVAAEVMVERDECLRELETTRSDAARVAPRVRCVERPRAKRCATEGPELLPVITTECQPGVICLDEKAQAAEAANVLAVRTWIEEVKKCERGD